MSKPFDHYKPNYFTIRKEHTMKKKLLVCIFALFLCVALPFSAAAQTQAIAAETTSVEDTENKIGRAHV